MKRILTFIITATFSLCSIVSSEEEATDSNSTPTPPKSDQGKPEGEAKSQDGALGRALRQGLPLGRHDRLAVRLAPEGRTRPQGSGPLGPATSTRGLPRANL